MTAAPFDPDQFDRLSTGSVPGYAALQDLVAHAAAALAPPASTVLDLGCGTGAGMLALARALPDAHLIGCDPAPPMVAATRSRCEAAGVTATVLVGGISAVAVDTRFDVIVCTLVLHFIPPDERVSFLAAIRARLRPGGALVLGVLQRSQDEAAQAAWIQIRRHYALARGVTPAELAAREAETRGKVYPLSSEELHDVLARAGFAPAIPLYQLLAVHSWLVRDGSSTSSPTGVSP
ncbi:MAG TPA: class I SAM-dependent methyltransferase [Kofleriaceae bacterium]